MVKVIKKTENTDTNAFVFPTITDEIFKLKIDKETQQFLIEGLENYGQFEQFTIRPLDIFNKLVAYDDEFKVKHESTLYRELKDAKDTMGCSASDKEGKVCGRTVWKNLTDKLSEDDKASNKEKAKFYSYLFGIASIKGKEPILIDYRVGGKNFMEVINLMKKIKDEKKEYNKAEIKVTAYNNPEFDWPELEFSLDTTRELPVAGLEPFLDTIEGYIEYHNDGIEKKAVKYKTFKEKGGFKRPTSFKNNR